MKRIVIASVFFVFAGGLALAGDIVIPEDTVPFEVQKDDVVRIPAKGIAGTQVTAKVTGPAKETISLISYRKNGKTLIGSGNHVVELKPTDKGKVTVEITIKPPNGKETTEKYEFEVK